MKIKNLFSAGLLSLLGVFTASAASLGVTASDQISNGLVSYTYLFSVTGSGAGIDNIYLGSNDLSPLNVAITVDGTNAANWSYLGNNTPQNYLQFFSTDGSSLNGGDTLGVKFQSIYAPGSSEYAIALNSTTGAATNEVTPLIGPNSLLTPEPASAGLLGLPGAALLTIALAAKLRRAA